MAGKGEASGGEMVAAGGKEGEEDPLVIDEEKPTEEEAGAEAEEVEDEEKEFEPTVDMIMNEFDDERTIDEEETMTQEDEAAELNALKDEQDMPIEELLKMYGYNKDAAKNATEAAPVEAPSAVVESGRMESEPEETPAAQQEKEGEAGEVEAVVQVKATGAALYCTANGYCNVSTCQYMKTAIIFSRERSGVRAVLLLPRNPDQSWQSEWRRQEEQKIVKKKELKEHSFVGQVLRGDCRGQELEEFCGRGAGGGGRGEW